MLAQPVNPMLPGGATFQVLERHESDVGGGSDTQTITIVFDGPTVGRVELRFMLDPASLQLLAVFRSGSAARARTRVGRRSARTR